MPPPKKREINRTKDKDKTNIYFFSGVLILYDSTEIKVKLFPLKINLA